MSLVILRNGGLRQVTLSLATAGVALNAAACLPDIAERLVLPASGAASPGGQVFRVLTFNMWQRNGSPLAAADLVARSGADVAALQEVGLMPPQGAERIRAAYPYLAACPMTACDVEIASRRPFRSVRYLAPSAASGGLAVVWGETTDATGASVAVAVTHFTWPFPPAAQARQRRALAALMAGREHGSMILAGDFNQSPWSAAMGVQDRALRPLTRRTHAIFSYPAVFEPLGASLPFPLIPIDHIYAGSMWRTVGITTLRNAGSSHYPVLAVFARNAGRDDQRSFMRP